MKKILWAIILFSLVSMPICAEEIPLTQAELVTPQNIDFAKCSKTYNLPAEKLYYMALLAVNANKFQIEEIQSKMGYIMFRGANKNFLMSVMNIDERHSILKITPTDNIYFFPYGVVYNIFRYIDLNLDEQLCGLSVLNNVATPKPLQTQPETISQPVKQVTEIKKSVNQNVELKPVSSTTTSKPLSQSETTTVIKNGHIMQITKP